MSLQFVYILLSQVTNDAVGRYSEMVSACYNFAWQGYRYLCIRSSGAPKIAINCCYSPAKLMAEVDFDPQNCSLDEPEDKDLNRLVLPTDSGSEIAINLNVKDRCEVRCMILRVLTLTPDVLIQ